MQKKISILGSGWLGLPLADALLAKGHRVHISTSSIEKQAELNSKGYQVRLIDICANKPILETFLECEVLIISITTYDVSCFQRLVERISESDIKQIIYISSTSVFDLSNIVIEADAPTNNSPIAQIERLFIEKLSDRTTLLRFSGLFGYNRKPGNFFKNRAIPNPQAFVNMIHRDDCIAIIQKLIEKGLVNKRYNAAADTHPTKEEFYTKASLDLGYPAPKLIKCDDLKFNIISNRALKIDLNYKFKYSDLMSIEYSHC